MGGPCKTLAVAKPGKEEFMAGSMKRKRRKKLNLGWEQLQSEQDLSDGDVSLARSMEFTLDKLKEKRSHAEFAELTSQQMIRQLHAKHQ